MFFVTWGHLLVKGWTKGQSSDAMLSFRGIKALDRRPDLKMTKWAKAYSKKWQFIRRIYAADFSVAMAQIINFFRRGKEPIHDGSA